MEQLLLERNNHSSAFQKILSTIRNKQKYTDVTLACAGKFYETHKLVLSMCSDYFEEIFEQSNNKNLMVVLKDITPADLELLLDYMYLGEVSVNQADLASLLTAAECLQIKGLAVADDEPTKYSSKKATSPVPNKKRKIQDTSDYDDSTSSYSSIKTRRHNNHEAYNEEALEEQMTDSPPIQSKEEIISYKPETVCLDILNEEYILGNILSPLPTLSIVEPEHILKCSTTMDPVGAENSRFSSSAFQVTLLSSIKARRHNNHEAYNEKNEEALEEQMTDSPPIQIKEEIISYVPEAISLDIFNEEEYILENVSSPLPTLSVVESEHILKSSTMEPVSEENSRFSSSAFQVTLLSSIKARIHNNHEAYNEKNEEALEEQMTDSPPIQIKEEIISYVPEAISLDILKEEEYIPENVSSPLPTLSVVESEQILKSSTMEPTMSETSEWPNEDSGLNTPTSSQFNPLDTKDQGSVVGLHKGMICPYCSKSFLHTQRTQFAEHIRIHTGEKPFWCKLCPYRTRQKGAWNKHVWFSHKEDL